MRGLVAVRIYPHLHEQAAPLLVRAQAAPAIGQRLRQHRHHAIGEIAGIATLAGRIIQRAGRAHIMRHVRDRHDQAKSVAIRFGIDRVIEIPRILTIDRNQWHLAQIGALTQGHTTRPLGFGQRFG